MRAILQPSDIRHRTTAMRTHLAVPRRILRTLLRLHLQQSFVFEIHIENVILWDAFLQQLVDALNQKIGFPCPSNTHKAVVQLLLPVESTSKKPLLLHRLPLVCQHFLYDFFIHLVSSTERKRGNIVSFIKQYDPFSVSYARQIGANLKETLIPVIYKKGVI